MRRVLRLALPQAWVALTQVDSAYRFASEPVCFAQDDTLNVVHSQNELLVVKKQPIAALIGAIGHYAGNVNQLSPVMLSEPQPRSGSGESKHLAFCMREHHYYVYMMISSSRRALYTGVTNSLDRRVLQHKNEEFEGFSQKYRAHRLVWFEMYSNIQTAIAREKQLKGWRRAKKNWLVQMMNPEWRDLSAEWGKPIPLLTPK